MDAEIRRYHPALDALIPKDAAVETLAGGFNFTEGPIWFQAGYLLFSDIPENTIYKWTPSGEITVFLKPSGCDAATWKAGAFIGSNGLTKDAGERLILCEHGNRRVTRLEPDGTKTVLASHYQGKRLNSPNDAVYKSDGALYFTDPPYGLVEEDKDPAKELSFNGVYRLKDGELTLLHQDLTRPNGLAFSPDEKILYVANSDRGRMIWMKFPVQEDGTLGAGAVFADVTHIRDYGAPDGMKVDTNGNLYCTGPGGTHVFDAAGNALGLIVTPEIPANLHWGEADARTLYITARNGLYRVRLTATGIRP
ncbi:MAG: SMP-30/gluconolactonase/LRE family protein [Candidatus Solibacter usitatus]|nr:SMP-30/gluconolactonase/LRE family protein [Candidatus Solibacter usitatus]